MRNVYVICLAILIGFGAYKGCLSFRSPEEVILDKLEAAVEGFNETRLSPVLDLFERDFVESNKGYTRDQIKSGVIAAFFREVDPQTKEFLYRVSVNEAEVLVEDDETNASATLQVDLQKLRLGEWKPVWSFDLEGDLVVTEYNGWQFRTAKVETVTGNRPR
ncbi:MAG: hypothetical protein ACI8TQ_003164 [Planctomycetota bacterium]|jgi:hypothetical protein